MSSFCAIWPLTTRKCQKTQTKRQSTKSLSLTFKSIQVMKGRKRLALGQPERARETGKGTCDWPDPLAPNHMTTQVMVRERVRDSGGVPPVMSLSGGCTAAGGQCPRFSQTLPRIFGEDGASCTPLPLKGFREKNVHWTHFHHVYKLMMLSNTSFTALSSSR